MVLGCGLLCCGGGSWFWIMGLVCCGGGRFWAMMVMVGNRFFFFFSLGGGL